MKTKAYVLEERRLMRNQINHEKEVMSRKFERIQGQKNFTELLTKEFGHLTKDMDFSKSRSKVTKHSSDHAGKA